MLVTVSGLCSLEKKKFSARFLPTKAGKLLWALAGGTPLRLGQKTKKTKQPAYYTGARTYPRLWCWLKDFMTHQKSGVWPVPYNCLQKRGCKDEGLGLFFALGRSGKRRWSEELAASLACGPCWAASIYWDLLRFARSPGEVKEPPERGAEKLRCELVNASWPQQAVSSAFTLSGR